uniref:ER membrane protein complex subunit 7 beta-sandwich domain-containing protein n=1 Tax=Glossina morsitans morsitans TaxID=37546 RepID=A0A1A9YUE3_GLOMM
MTLKMILIFGLVFILINLIKTETVIQDEIVEEINLYTIEGKVYPPDNYAALNYIDNTETIRRGSKWQIDTSISINGGEYKGFLREDGSFIISGIPSGSYVVEIDNADYFYEAVRVEINPKGKFRARKVNYIQPSQVIQVPYPLKLKPLTKYQYFQTREQWKITDFLFSPMVLMMILPLFLLLVLPKMINDPETKKELESISFPKINNDMPEISEMITSFFTGAKPPEKPKPSTSNKQNKKRN